jgi:outer membrane murein-binding lipoprotein Lpp
MKLYWIAALLLLQGCSQIYYSTWEMLGKQKRDLLRDNVEDLSTDQKEVQEEVQDALTRLRTLYGSPSEKLTQVYDDLKSDYDSAKSKAAALHARIEKVDDIANDLFSEWDAEIGRLKTPKYKQDSRHKLQQTKQKYAKLEASVRKAEKGLTPVLAALEEQVIYLKHNLNAQALGGIKAELHSVESEIKTLSSALQSSIQESQSFVSTLNTDGPST